MGEIELKSLPEDMSAMATDPGHLGRVPIDGCFKQQVKVQGEVREFYAYLPEGLESCRPCLVVAPPSGEDGLKYMEDSGLRAFADGKKLFLFVLILLVIINVRQIRQERQVRRKKQKVKGGIRSSEEIGSDEIVSEEIMSLLGEREGE